MDVNEHIPAWKRVGLQVQKNTEEENVFTPVHLEEGKLTHKQKKKLVNRNRDESQEKDKSTPRKPPKRLKKPKSERGPPPEKDQLAYLRQFEHDRANWKFSKQKQNWILKNIRYIPVPYENSLKVYISSVQGGSRERLIDDLVDVIDKWNKKIEEMDAKIEKQLEQLADNSTHTEKTKEENSEEYGKQTDSNPNSGRPDNASGASSESAEDESSNDNITKDYVRRCGILLKCLGREDITARGIHLFEHGSDAAEPNSTLSGSDDVAEAVDNPNDNVQDTFVEKGNGESLKRSRSVDDDQEDTLLLSSVDVTGISKNASHLSQIEKNRLKRLKLDDKASVPEQDGPSENLTKKTLEDEDKKHREKHSSKKKKKSSKKRSSKKKK